MNTSWMFRQIILRISQVSVIVSFIMLVGLADNFKLSHFISLFCALCLSIIISIKLSDTHSFIGFFVGCFICLVAWMCKTFHIHTNFFLGCYKIRSRFGSSLCCLDFCAYRYDKYMEEN